MRNLSGMRTNPNKKLKLPSALIDPQVGGFGFYLLSGL